MRIALQFELLKQASSTPKNHSFMIQEIQIISLLKISF